MFHLVQHPLGVVAAVVVRDPHLENLANVSNRNLQSGSTDIQFTFSR